MSTTDAGLSPDAIYSRRYRDRKRGGPPRQPKPCGTRAAAKRHRAAGEPLCGPCQEAERAYQRDVAARRRAAKSKGRKS